VIFMVGLIDIIEIASGAWPAGVTMLGLGSGFALVLLVASMKLKVEVDPKIEQIHAALPKLDCGACGYPGCGQYAKAVLSDPSRLGACAPGGPAATEAIAAILNLQISDSGSPMRPAVHCRARTEDKTYIAEYTGIPSCTSANALASTQACRFGCLGYGDCTRSCRFDALHIINGVAVVDYSRCTGCGACARACPRLLIEMVPFNEAVIATVASSSRESGKNTRAVCKVGCIGCGLCVKKSDLFNVEDNLARIEYSRYAPGEAVAAAIEKCPTGVIIELGR
jgi:RnfABCDGE-type electron transport complex B subunit